MLGESDRFKGPENQPPNSKFKLKRRMPGWRPDTIKNQALFPEEMLLKDKAGKFYAFQPPLDDPQAASWPLGNMLPDPPKTDFEAFLTEGARSARTYNAALYWMRRLHFHENAIPAAKAPEYNKHGDRSATLPDPSSQELAKLIEQAEDEWSAAIQDLNAVLAGGGNHRYRDTRADMVEVNGYIVSMRIVSQKDSWFKEIGGSESSHVYLSSPFSSFSSSSNSGSAAAQESFRAPS